MIVMGDGSGERTSPEKLVDFQGSPPTSSRTAHLLVQEIKQRWQEAYMDEPGAPDYTETQKESL